MKTNIRHSVFETNSSSTHCISISNNLDNIQLVTPDDDGIVRIPTGEFGWNEKEFHDFETKASYLATYIINLMGEDKGSEHYNQLKEAICEQTGATDIEIIDNDGYIDHQSAYEPLEAFASSSRLRRYLFSKESVLITGNDNG